MYFYNKSDVFEDLINFVRNDVQILATEAYQIIAIGEFCDAVEKWRDGSEATVEVNVEIGISYTEGDPSYSESQGVYVRVNSDKIEFSTLYGCYSKESGSDNHTVKVAVFSNKKWTGWNSMSDWINKRTDVIDSDKRKVTVSRDHF